METPAVTPQLTAAAKEALRYFSVMCRGMEVDEFWDGKEPDLFAAREHAEALRDQLRDLRLLDTFLTVEQRVNKVTVIVDVEAVNRLGDWS